MALSWEFLTQIEITANAQVAENKGSRLVGTAFATYSRRTKCYGGCPMEAQVRDWRVLSEAASREQDPDKLIALVEELNLALQYREMQAYRRFARN